MTIPKNMEISHWFMPSLTLQIYHTLNYGPAFIVILLWLITPNKDIKSNRDQGAPLWIRLTTSWHVIKCNHVKLKDIWWHLDGSWWQKWELWGIKLICPASILNEVLCLNTCHFPWLLCMILSDKMYQGVCFCIIPMSPWGILNLESSL